MESQSEKLKVKHYHVRYLLKATLSMSANMGTEIAWQIFPNKLILLNSLQNENTKSKILIQNRRLRSIFSRTPMCLWSLV